MSKMTAPRATGLKLPRTPRARSSGMPLHESKAAATRRRREATRKFLDDHAYEVRRLKDQNAGHEMTNPTIDQLEAVLAARHPTEFRYESFAYLSGRSPQAEGWHKGEAQWAQDKVDARHRCLRAASNRGVRSAERAAEAVAAGATGDEEGSGTRAPRSCSEPPGRSTGSPSSGP